LTSSLIQAALSRFRHRSPVGVEEGGAEIERVG
jgi:hypothetical protein